MSDNPFDDLLNIACGFDWLTPAWAFLNDFLEGPAAHWGISFNTTWDSRAIRKLLQKKGVKSWGYMLNTDGTMIMFSTKKTQARYAGYVLQEAGVPVLYSPIQQQAYTRNLQHEDKKDNPLAWLYGSNHRKGNGKKWGIF